MELIQEVTVEAATELDLGIDAKLLASGPFIKLVGSGELAAAGRDRRFLVMLTDSGGAPKPLFYNSYGLMNGHAHLGEWDGRGFYVGRNGWGLDASMAVEFTLTKNMLTNKIIGLGKSTFSMANQSVLGYEAHGFAIDNNPIEGVKLVFDGGTFSGSFRLYKY